MKQLTSLDAQFLNVETATQTGHVGALLILDPTTAPDGRLDFEAFRDLWVSRLHLVPLLRQRLVEVPLSLGFPYWVDDPHFDLEYHLREIGLPAPGDSARLAEQVSRIHARSLDRSRPLWEAYLIQGLEGGRAAVYTKVHHAVIDGISGAEILVAILDTTAEPRPVEPPETEWRPEPMPNALTLLARGVSSTATTTARVVTKLPETLPHLIDLPGAANIPGARVLSDIADAVVSLAQSRIGPRRTDQRDLTAPRTPFNGPITAHRRFAYGSVPLSDVKLVKNAFGLTVNDVVMAMTTTALRRWLLDHDALPQIPLVAAIPVSIRSEPHDSAPGNQISVMLAQLPTHVADPAQRLRDVAESMLRAKEHFEAVPASILQDLSAAIPTALSGLASRALFRLVTMPGPPFNLFVSNVPGPQLPLYVSGARVEGVHPVSAVTDLTGGLNITLFSYDGQLDFGLIACRELVPDVGNLVGYLTDALAELVALAEVVTVAEPG